MLTCFDQSVDLVNAYIARIGEMNSTLHMVTEIDPDALAIAADLDDARAAGNVTGPLHGVPVLIKNNIATDDRMNNTAGSFALLGATVNRDSTMARKLRQAGAIILGKSNLSQWANYRSSNTSNGWSAYGGQTYGAYIQNRTYSSLHPSPTSSIDKLVEDPSGSSSGSGVASSLGLAWASLGTETSGSILSPSQQNNLVGIKPTVGLTSRFLVIPISSHQDTIGPMARTVKDAAYLLQAIAGRDSRDNYTNAIPRPNNLPDYVAACQFNSLQGARIGIPSNVIDLYVNTSSWSPVLSAFNSMVDIIKKAGATVVDAPFTGLAEYRASSNSSIVLGADFRSGTSQRPTCSQTIPTANTPPDLEDYLSRLRTNPNRIRNLTQLRDWTQSHPQEQWSPTARDVRIWNNSLALGYGNDDIRFWTAYQANLYLGGNATLLGAIQRNKLDAIVLPTSFSAGFAAIVGAPVVTIPMGAYPANTTVRVNAFNVTTAGPNIPFGLAFLGDKFTEAKLIGMAYALEQRTRVRERVLPYTQPRVELADVVKRR